MKKIIAGITLMACVCTVALFGNMNPGSVSAENDYDLSDKEPLVKILTCSDYQLWTSDWKDNWAVLQPQLREICNGAYGAGFTDPDFFLYGGDFSCLNSVDDSNTGKSQVVGIIQDTWSSITDENSLILQGNHDPAGTDGLAETGAYEFDDYIIYMLNEDDYPSKQAEESSFSLVQTTAWTLEDYLYECIDRGETRPIFIASHTGLHYDIDRLDGNNQYAYILCDAINEVSKELDVIFLFGHNHSSGDEQVGGSINFFAKGDMLDICHEDSISNKSGTPTEINFTYLNYGYIGGFGDLYNNATEIPPADILTVSRLEIYDDVIKVDRYSKNGHEENYTEFIPREHWYKPTPEPVATQVPQTNVVTASPVPQSSVQPQPAPETVKESFKIKASKKTVKAGKKVTVKVVKSGIDGKAKWSVSKGSKLVKLSKKTGNSIKVTCRKKGKAVIKASCGKYSAKVTIKIK